MLARLSSLKRALGNTGAGSALATEDESRGVGQV